MLFPLIVLFLLMSALVLDSQGFLFKQLVPTEQQHTLPPVDSIHRLSARRAYHKNCSLTLWPSLRRKAVKYNC